MNGETDEKVLDFAGKLGVSELMQRAKARQAAEDAPPEAAAEPVRIEDVAADEVPGPEKLTPLPKPGDPYKAHARQSTGAVPTLFVVRADGSVRGFPYSDLYGPDLVPEGDAGKGWAIVMRFARFEQVTLSGRNLDKIHAYLGHHRMPWVRELPKGKLPSDQDGPVITGVAIAEIEQ